MAVITLPWMERERILSKYTFRQGMIIKVGGTFRLQKVRWFHRHTEAEVGGKFNTESQHRDLYWPTLLSTRQTWPELGDTSLRSGVVEEVVFSELF